MPCKSMKLVPAMVDRYERLLAVPCRHCWRCRLDRVYDWVGRAIAENEVCTRAYFVTMTYGRTNRIGESLEDRARTLHYPDIQKWLKRIRKNHNVRYIVTGEYGSKKGRAHWHALLFFRGKLPDVKLGFKYWGTGPHNTDPFWTDGHTQWETFHPAHAKYVCKYMLKSDDALHPSMAMLSKKPPLGHEYFVKRAEWYVEQGLSPQDMKYTFPHLHSGKGKPREYYLQGVSRDNFLAAFIEKWRAKHGKDSWPYSELIEDMLDREAMPERDKRLAERPAAPRASSPLQRYEAPPLERYPTQRYGVWNHQPRAVGVDAKLNLWKCWDRSDSSAVPLYWSYDQNGFAGWQEVPNLITEAQAVVLRAAYASPQKAAESYLSPAARARADGWTIPSRPSAEVSSVRTYPPSRTSAPLKSGAP